jgi:hypothetical protein
MVTRQRRQAEADVRLGAGAVLDAQRGWRARRRGLETRRRQVPLPVGEGAARQLTRRRVVDVAGDGDHPALDGR